MGSRHRLNHLLGMRVVFADGRDAGQVVDVRLGHGERVAGLVNELVVDGFIVGRPRPGTLFGYDRHPDQGPWLLGKVVRRLHRHSGFVAWRDVDDVDWPHSVVRLRTDELADVSRSRAAVRDRS